MKTWMACNVAVSLLASVPAWPAPSVPQQVEFKKGQTGATITGRLEESQIVDYKLRAGAGQAMVVQFKPSNPSACFNVLPPGSDAALLVGSTSGELAWQRQDVSGWVGVNGREIVFTPDALAHGG